MPTYEYLCEKCGKNFDAYQSMKDNAYRTCPKELCRKKIWGKGRVKRLLGAGAGLIFKGSGFYTTDYRSSGYNEAAKKDTATTETKTTDSKKPAPAAEKAKSKKTTKE